MRRTAGVQAGARDGGRPASFPADAGAAAGLAWPGLARRRAVARGRPVSFARVRTGSGGGHAPGGAGPTDHTGPLAAPSTAVARAAAGHGKGAGWRGRGGPGGFADTLRPRERPR